MKNSFFIFCFILTIGSSQVQAGDAESVPLTEYEKNQVARAITILLKYHIITFNNEAQCIEVKRDLIHELLNDVLIKKESSVLMSICADGSN